MANILVLGVKVPFTHGGQEVLVGTLVKELRSRGHEADVIELPLNVLPKESLVTQAAMWRAIDFEQFCGTKIDLVIGTKFPSYYARHPKKSIWLVHQLRSIYDLYATRFSDFSDDIRDEALRSLLGRGDSQVIGESAYVSAISKNVAERLERFNSIKADVLYPPLPLAGRYKQHSYEPYILSVGRLCRIKRVDLMLRALPHCDARIKLKIVGAPDDPGIMPYLNNEIAKHHLQSRVEFCGRVPDEQLIDLYANAMAVYYAPFDEDYGYVTLEAMASAKAVITAYDSGGVLEFAVHDKNALISAATAEAIGHSANRLLHENGLAERLGKQGLADINSLGVLESGWDKVIAGLLSPITERVR